MPASKPSERTLQATSEDDIPVRAEDAVSLLRPAPGEGSGIARADIAGYPTMNLANLDWDRYGRFKFVAGLIASRHPDSPLRILDVGGDLGYFAPFVPDHELYVADEKTTGANGAALPARDRAFHLAVSFDTLEHVRPRERSAFISEISRVASDAVYLTYPHAASAGAQWFAWQLTRNAYLTDHFRLGLPADEDVRTIIEKLGCSGELFHQGFLGSFMAMMLALHKAPLSDYIKLNRYWNENFGGRDNFEPTLRSVWRITPRPQS